MGISYRWAIVGLGAVAIPLAFPKGRHKAPQPA